MRIPSLRTAAIIVAVGIGLGGCTTYDPFGYGGVSVGYGYSNSPYGYDYGSPYGYGYGSPFGWYDSYYYPGSGYYVYDSYRRPHVWSDRQRHHWATLNTRGTTTTATAVARPNWTGFDRARQSGARDDRGTEQLVNRGRAVRVERQSRVSDIPRLGNTPATETDNRRGDGLRRQGDPQD